MLTPKSMPAVELPEPLSYEEADIEEIRDTPTPTNKEERATADSIEAIDRYEGINPRFLRAAAKLEKARVDIPRKEKAPPRDSDPDEEAWRKELEASSAGSVISFLPPTFVENPAVMEGFPENQKNRAPKGGMRPSMPPKPPPIPKKR